jgi:lipid II:glycine glycyltransferase (peptidoglycan interpeptide bridge formation enzyme)
MSLSTERSSPGASRRGAFTMREVRSTTQPEWDGWLQALDGHIYQSYDWGGFKRRLGWKPVRLVLERDGAVVGLGQFLVWSTPGVPGTLMYSTKGPWLPWDDEEAVRTFFGGVRTVAERENVHTVKIEPEIVEEQTAPKAVLAGIGFRKARWDLNYKTTMIIDLEPSEEELLARMKEKTRYNIRLAGRRGVEVVEDNSPEARETLWRMMETTAERDGFSIRRTKDYHYSVWDLIYSRDRAHLFFAQHEGDRLAAMMIYAFGRKYWYMVGASTNEKRKLMPPYKLQWEGMRWAKVRGITRYDMVAIPRPEDLTEENEMYGLYRFKSGFGGEITDFVGCYDWPIRKIPAAAWYRWEPIYYRLYQRLKHDVYY